MKTENRKVYIFIFLAVLLLIILGSYFLIDTPIGDSFEEGFKKGYKLGTE